MDKYTLEALNRFINYAYDDESKHYEESDKPKDHIFEDIKLVSDWVDSQMKERGLI